jgi:hypothetical protein
MLGTASPPTTRPRGQVRRRQVVAVIVTVAVSLGALALIDLTAFAISGLALLPLLGLANVWLRSRRPRENRHTAPPLIPAVAPSSELVRALILASALLVAGLLYKYAGPAWAGGTALVFVLLGAAVGVAAERRR